MFQDTGSPLLIRPREALDAPQFEQLRGVSLFASEIYNTLAVPAETLHPAMAAFYEHGQNPDLSAKHANLDELQSQEVGLKDFKDGLLEDLEVHPVVKDVYRWRVNELLANIRMAQASSVGDMRRFDRYNHFIYGTPDPKITAAVVDWFRQGAIEAVDGSKASVGQAGEDVLSLLPDLDGDRDILVPDPITFERVRADHYREGGYYALLLAGVDLKDATKVTPDLGETALEQVLKNIEADHYERKYNTNGKAWGVSNGKGEIKGPQDYDMPVNRFIGLALGHEVGSHILEYVNGLRSGLMLNALGLDRYELGNEGRAVIREQVPYETFEKFSRLLRWQDILRRHFAISYGLGVTGEPQAFKQVFEVVHTIDRLWERKKNPDNAEKADAAARTRTESLLTQNLKGTNGQGGAYRKNIVYLEGNVHDWRLAKSDPRIISEGDKGKFDLANSRHTEIERRLGILAA